MARFGSATARGYGWRHQLERVKALSALVQGSPCALCGCPMFHPEQQLDLDHSVPCVFGGEGPRRLTHARCNRRAGAFLKHRLRRRQLLLADYAGLNTSREW